MTAMGFYLIRDGKFVFDRALSEGDDVENYAQRWLSAGVVLFGVYAVTISVPGAMRILSNLVVVLQAPAYVGVEDWWERFYLDFLPTMSIFILGWIGFKNSKALARTALR
ncbi:MAG: hypothetical protein EXR70_06630 [Deltaproteobacteria bacterium]|nr:hypothetical protein [Deltaproteobacteria bacterium]